MTTSITQPVATSSTEERIQTLLFGDGLVGFHHRPIGVPRTCGIVLCPTHGEEGLCAYWAYRTLARRLAVAGFHCLRFDPHGTGDSRGDDRSPERVAAWLSSIDSAVDVLRARSGVAEISLFGMRIGGTLATQAASRRDDIASLVLWSPCTTGRVYLRELHALQMMLTGTEFTDKVVAGVKNEGDVEAAGFLFSAETVADLRALKPFTSARRPAPRILVIGRDTLPLDTALLDGLRATGAAVDTREADGYAGIMVARHEAVLPEAVLGEVTRWLSATHPERAQLSEAVSPEATSVLAGDGWQETLIQLGPDRSLIGVLTEAAPPTGGDRPPIILINMGSNHRVGCNNLHVTMARTWAAAGFPVLRFDLAGLGDSAPRAGTAENVCYPPRALDDIRAAVAYFVQRDKRGVVLLGLCAGAYHAFKATVELPGVRAAILINTLTFNYVEGQLDAGGRSRQTNVNDVAYYRKALFRKATWLKLLEGNLAPRRALTAIAKRVATLVEDRAREALGRGNAGSVGRELERLVDRGTHVAMIYADEDPGIDLLDSVAGRSLARLERHPSFVLHKIVGADHTFTPLWSQHELITFLTGYLESRF